MMRRPSVSTRHNTRVPYAAPFRSVCDAASSPKYVNSPETALFHNGRELYGLWQVRQANSRIERLIVVEGYMDVVALFQHGVTHAVATLGTATTPDHVALLFRHAPAAYVCVDRKSDR